MVVDQIQVDERNRAREIVFLFRTIRFTRLLNWSCMTFLYVRPLPQRPKLLKILVLFGVTDAFNW